MLTPGSISLIPGVSAPPRRDHKEEGMIVALYIASCKDRGGEIMLVSQFTLHASTKKGNRPSYIRASKPEIAIPLYEGMIVALYIAAAVIMAAGSLYLTWRSVDFRKFLAGAFLVSSGILFYLYLAAVSVTLLGTNVVFTCGAAPGSDGGSIGMARTCKNETFPSATTGRVG